jgi:hypothetical protein
MCCTRCWFILHCTPLNDDGHDPTSYSSIEKNHEILFRAPILQWFRSSWVPYFNLEMSTYFSFLLFFLLLLFSYCCRIFSWSPNHTLQGSTCITIVIFSFLFGWSLYQPSQLHSILFHHIPWLDIFLQLSLSLLKITLLEVLVVDTHWFLLLLLYFFMNFSFLKVLLAILQDFIPIVLFLHLWMV